MPETFDRGLPSLMTNWTPSLAEVAQPTSEGTLNAAHDTFQMLQGDATTSPKDIARTKIFQDYLDYCRGARNFVGIDEYLEPDFSSTPEPVMAPTPTYGVDVDLSEVPEEKRFVIKPVDDLDDYDEDDEYESPDFETLSDDAEYDVEVISLGLDDWGDSSDGGWEDLEDSSETDTSQEGTFDYPDDSEDEWEDSTDGPDLEEDEWGASIDDWEDSSEDPDSEEDEWENSSDGFDSEEDEWEDSSDDSEDSDGWEDSTDDLEDSDDWEDSWEADSNGSPTPSVPQHSGQMLSTTPAPKPALTKERRAAGSFERIFDRLTQKGTR